MRRQLLVILSFLCISAFIAVGCSKSDKPADNSSAGASATGNRLTAQNVDKIKAQQKPMTREEVELIFGPPKTVEVKEGEIKCYWEEGDRMIFVIFNSENTFQNIAVKGVK